MWLVPYGFSRVAREATAGLFFQSSLFGYRRSMIEWQALRGISRFDAVRWFT
jgi:hypothetical protein